MEPPKRPEVKPRKDVPVRATLTKKPRFKPEDGIYGDDDKAKSGECEVSYFNSVLCASCGYEAYHHLTYQVDAIGQANRMTGAKEKCPECGGTTWEFKEVVDTDGRADAGRIA